MDVWNRDRVRRFRAALRRWYGNHQRALPWRESRDPYRIWISEIMLQQTTVAAVIPYYERFLGRFPDVRTLAQADESDVLKLWEGLGYYSRARNIHRTAQIIADQWGGHFPATVGELQTLPGIGRYTAGAVASFAFDERAPILEANTLRLHARLIGCRESVQSSAGQAALWDSATRVLPRKDVGAFNQALMDLGATVCRPTEPDCDRCPVRNCCVAFESGTQGEIPVAKARPAVTDVTEAYFAVERDGRYWLRQCSEDERWAGLWDFPRMGVQDGRLASLKATSPGQHLLRGAYTDLERYVERRWSVQSSVTGGLTEIRHGVTRYRIRLLCLHARWEHGEPNEERTRWVSSAQMKDLPLSKTGRKLANLLLDRDTTA